MLRRPLILSISLLSASESVFTSSARLPRPARVFGTTKVVLISKVDLGTGLEFLFYLCSLSISLLWMLSDLAPTLKRVCFWRVRTIPLATWAVVLNSGSIRCSKDTTSVSSKKQPSTARMPLLPVSTVLHEALEKIELKEDILLFMGRPSLAAASSFSWSCSLSSSSLDWSLSDS